MNTSSKKVAFHQTSDTNKVVAEEQGVKLIPAYDAAKYIGVSFNTFKAMVKANQIPFTQFNKRKKFSTSALDKFLKSGE